MTTEDHIGRARRQAIEVLAGILDDAEDLEKAVLVHDLFGRLRVILWLMKGADEQALRERVLAALAACGHFWTGDIWTSSTATPRADKLIYESAWEEGITVPDHDKLRIDDRTRTRTGWLPRFRVPDWSARRSWNTISSSDERAGEGPPVIVFYSFKGGVGRTTALAAFALQRAQEGELVFVLDLDLDAPGAGTLLSGDFGDSPLGVVDYLLEASLGEVRIEDFTHTCKRDKLVGDSGGKIVVMPAGRVDEDYLSKLSRLDLEIRGDENPLGQLLTQARYELRPDWILIDSRAGLSAAAGVLLDGTAHLNVLFGTNSPQSQLGLTQVLRHLGEERIRRDAPQARCVVVQAMVVDIVEVEKKARAQFSGWLEGTLRAHYLVAADDDPNDEFWSERDLDSTESPARAVAIPYRARLAFFPSIDDVVSDLVVGPYAELASRIEDTFDASRSSVAQGED